MSALQGHPWSRQAIHDTVAVIVRQRGYRRDLRSTLLDRILEWIADAYHRLFDALGGVPHGRVIATTAAAVVALLIVARVTYAARLRTAGDDSAKARKGGGRRSGDPWGEAEALAEGGHFTDAAHALY